MFIVSQDEAAIVKDPATIYLQPRNDGAILYADDMAVGIFDIYEHAICVMRDIADILESSKSVFKVPENFNCTKESEQDIA